MYWFLYDSELPHERVKDVINVFSVKNKDTGLKSLALSAVFIVNFEHLNIVSIRICIQAVRI